MTKYITFRIVIKDSGAGISKEGLKNLFLDFSSLEEHRGENKRGTGLGLSICKKIIQVMGGTVEVESELGVGTTFTIKITTKCKGGIEDKPNSNELLMNSMIPKNKRARISMIHN